MKVCAVIAVLALIGSSAEAASKKHKPQARGHGAYGAQPRVACTPAGCLPVPRGCYPAPGRTWDGDPTGFDVMVCGRGSYTMYGTR